MFFGGLAHGHLTREACPARPHSTAVAPLHLGEKGARLHRKLTDGHLPLFSLVVLELDGALVLLERSEERGNARIADLDEGLDRSRDGLGVGVAEETPEELRRTRLGDLGDQVRELGEGRISRFEAVERPLHAERHLLEPLVSHPFERVSCCMAGLRLVVAEKVDEEIDRCAALQLAEERCDPDETQGLLLRVLQYARRVKRLSFQGRDEGAGITPAGLGVSTQDFGVGSA